MSQQIIDLSGLPADSYVAMEQIGPCKVCGKKEDLRCGVCYDCCKYVDGEPFKDGHRLWDKRDPRKTWYVLPH